MSSVKTTAKKSSSKSGSAANGSNDSQGQGAVFVMAALDMTWRLVIVILVPVLGGYYLGQHFDANPALVILGFILAMIGMTVVMWRQMQKFSPKITKSDIENAKKLREKEDKEDEN